MKKIVGFLVLVLLMSCKQTITESDLNNLNGYWEIEKVVLPDGDKKEYKVKLKDADKDFVFNETEADLNKFDKIIDEVEPGSLRLPVLIKKYIKQNARVVAFNVDPLFNNSVDGLMYIKIADLPESTVKPVMEEFQAELEKKDKG